MEHAGYVVTGWIGTGVVLSAYAVWVERRTRRARRARAGADGSR
jgi:hypothetical protein